MEYTGLNDYEVLYMIGEGDETAYNVMHDKYRPLISKLALKYYKQYKEFGLDYEELYLEGLVALNNAVREFHDSNDCLFYTYLLVCIRHAMETLLRGKRRYKHMVLNNAISLEQEIEGTDMVMSEIVSDTNSDIEKNVFEADLSKKLLDVRYELSVNQSLVYELKLNGFSNREVAELLNISYKKVDNACKLIRSKLKKSLGKLQEYVI